MLQLEIAKNEIYFFATVMKSIHGVSG